MKKKFLKILIVLALAVGFVSCEDLDDKLQVPSNLQIENFIWKGLNLYYLWQADVPDLADTRFSTQSELNTFLSDFSSPENLFQHLRTAPDIDRFSWIVSDYTVLENSFQGIYKSNGLEYGLKYIDGSDSQIFGYIKYIIPNSDAENKGLKRGDIFYAVDGTNLTAANYQDLLGKESYTLHLAQLIDNQIIPTNESIQLVKYQLTENPILINKVFDLGNKKVGYLMYNAFTANFDTHLNAAFGELKSQNITDLVLDLRYNGGGSVLTAARLASMITGQFSGQLFSKQQWNSKVQAYLEEEAPGNLINTFETKIGNEYINHLNLSKIYILTTGSSASASELVINGLQPYINVIKIGTKTVGKNVGSITLYDSPSFSRNGRSTAHKYAMQPLTFKIVNKDGFGDYFNGLEPNTEVTENLEDMGVLGDANEALLAEALSQISGNNRLRKMYSYKTYKTFSDKKSQKPFGNDMYLEGFTFPENFIRFLNE